MNKEIEKLESKLATKDTNFLKRQYASRLLEVDSMKEHKEADASKTLMELGAIYNILVGRGVKVPLNSKEFAQKAIKGLSKKSLD